MESEPPALSLKRKRTDDPGLKNAPKATSMLKESAMTERQSFLAIQAMLQSSVAIITHLRGLLPSQCYVKEMFASLEDVSRYLATTVNNFHTAQQRSSSAILRDNKRSSPDAIESDRQGLENTSLNNDPFSLILLARGRTAACDQLLRWIDVVLQALKDHHIDAVNFAITKDRSNQTDILESYTFFFEYHIELDTGRKLLRGMSLSKSADKPVAVGIRQGLEPIINRLISLSIVLTRLPETRFLSCHVRHRWSSPYQYTLEGFRPSRNLHIQVPDDIGWRWATTDLGSWHSGVHTVTFDTGYLAYTGQNISDSDVGKRIPSQLTYSKRRPRFTRGDGRTVHQQPPDLTKTATMGLSPPALDPSEERPRSAIEAAESPTRDLQSIANVHSMLESASRPPGLTTELDSLLLTQELPESLRRDPPPRQLQLKLEVMQDIRASPNGIMPSSPLSTYGATLDVVRCQCGSKKIEGRIIRCVICDTAQHRQCYGFLADNPAEEHVCYRCLLKDRNDPHGNIALAALGDLAKKRRMLWLLYDCKMDIKGAHFRQAIAHYDRKLLDRYMNNLRRQGFFETHPDRAEEVLVRTPDQMQERFKNYGDPMTYVTSHYTIVQVSTLSYNEEPPAKRTKAVTTRWKE